MKGKMQTLTDRRNYGIDLFRIISMIMILILHILGHGGILESSTTLFAHNKTAWFLEIAAYCAVDSYGFISGYVGYGKKQKYSNLFYLYFQVLFYTVITTAIFAIYKPKLVGFKLIIQALVPFAYNTYWYFSAYFCLFFFIPFLNLILDRFEKTTVRKLIFCLFIIFSLLPTLFFSDFGFTNNGYSVLWLVIMYLVGAYIRKYGISFSYANKINLFAYIFLVVLTWLSKILIEFLTLKVFGEPKGGNYLISYTSPSIVFCALFLLLFFSQMACSSHLIKFIRFFAPVSFGVYLFHEEPLIRSSFISGAFTEYLTFHPFTMILAVIGSALIIWFVGSFVDRVRFAIFNLLRVRLFCTFIEQKMFHAGAGFKKRIVSIIKRHCELQ